MLENQPQCDGALLPSCRSATVMHDYVHPREVVEDDRLNQAEKRTILCFWASDACSVESRPGFRWLPGTPGPILFDHVMAALWSLDDNQNETAQSRVEAPHIPQGAQPGA